jgi:hypothetical protein
MFSFFTNQPEVAYAPPAPTEFDCRCVKQATLEARLRGISCCVSHQGWQKSTLSRLRKNPLTTAEFFLTLLI